MPDLDDVSIDALQDALAAVDGKTPTLRVTAAIAYKNGVTQTELASWFDVERKTIYNWLQRVEQADDIAAAVTDEPRPGRPRKLSSDALDKLATEVNEPPTAAGYDARAWRPELLQEHVATTYDAEYSLPSCRRLLRELQD